MIELVLKFAALVLSGLSLTFNVWAFFRLSALESTKAANSRITTIEETVKGLSVQIARSPTSDAMAAAHSLIRNTLEEHTTHIAEMQRDIKHMPNDDDLKRLHARIDEVNGSLQNLEGEFKGANKTLELIHSFLLNGGKT